MSELVREDFLVFHHVSKIYAGEGDSEPVVIFKDFSWKVPRGACYAIVGESGVGKSTLLHLVAALDRPDAGTICVENREISRLPEKDLSFYRAYTISIIFQFHFLLKEFTAAENIFLPGWMAGMKKKDAVERADFLLNRVGLFSKRNHYPGQLSGGERQKVALARCLINDPPFILADEPTGNLDERNSSMVEELLLQLVQQEKKTLLLVTHNKNFAKKTEQVWHLSQGRLTQELT